MSRIELLLKAYQRTVSLPWQKSLSGPEKVWFCIYDSRDERRLRIRLDDFKAATEKAGHSWRMFRLDGRFEEWMAAEEYRESYFQEPEFLSSALDGFAEWLAKQLRDELSQADQDAVIALVGADSLFGIAHISNLVGQVTRDIRGRLLVFFPGVRRDSNYRLLDGQDGWTYLALPIEATEE